MIRIQNAFLLLLGPATIAASFLLMVERVEPIADHFYLFAWYGLIFTFDQLMRAIEGRSLIARCGPGFVLLLLWSATAWFFFELVNFRIQNWYYIFVPSRALSRVVHTFIAFATVFPGIFWIEHLLSIRGLIGDVRGRVLSLWPARLYRLQLYGLICLALPLSYPRYFFPLVWVSALLIVAPINYRRGVDGLLRQLEAGEYGPLLRMLLAGLVAGFFWEFFNFWARAKWIYTVPFFEELKLFEMPVLGFLGFPPFAVECACLYRFLVWHGLAPPFGSFAQQRPDAASARSRAALVSAALLFSLAVWVGVDRYTVASVIPTVKDVASLDPATREYLAQQDIRYLTDLEGLGSERLWQAIDAELERDRATQLRRITALYLHQGIGGSFGNALVEAGFSSLEDLRGQDAQSVLARMAAVPVAAGFPDQRLPTSAQVRLWLRRLPD